MGLKFLDNIRGALGILKDGRFKKAIINTYLLIAKIRNVTTFLHSEGRDNKRIIKATGGVDKGLDQVESVLARILKFFKISPPVIQQSAYSDLEAALADLDNACGSAEESARDLPEGVIEVDLDDDD